MFDILYEVREATLYDGKWVWTDKELFQSHNKDLAESKAVSLFKEMNFRADIMVIDRKNMRIVSGVFTDETRAKLTAVGNE